MCAESIKTHKDIYLGFLRDIFLSYLHSQHLCVEIDDLALNLGYITHSDSYLDIKRDAMNARNTPGSEIGTLEVTRGIKQLDILSEDCTSWLIDSSDILFFLKSSLSL